MWALSTFEGGTAYHHGDLRRSLIAAAQELLRSGGAEAVTLREAARLAGVSHNAPYRHFASRDALLAALAAEGSGRSAARSTRPAIVPRAPSGSPPSAGPICALPMPTGRPSG